MFLTVLLEASLTTPQESISQFFQIVVISMTDKAQNIRRHYATVILVMEILLKLLVLRILNLLHHSPPHSLITDIS